MTNSMAGAAGQQQHLCDNSSTQTASLVSLPEPLLALIAQCLPPGGGSRENLRLACQTCAAATRLTTTGTLDIVQLGSSSWANDTTLQLPVASAALRQYPNIRGLVAPSWWQRAAITQLLQHAAGGGSSSAGDASTSDSSSSRRPNGQLTGLTLHFKSVCPSLCAAVAAHAPGLTHLQLCLDLAFELTSRQAWRIAALSRLTSLRSLTLEPDLRPEALAALSSLRGLLELTLSGSSHISHPGSSLRALCGLTQLTGLAFNWTGGRTCPDASPLTALTRLRKLACFLGAAHDMLPMTSNRPLRGLMAAIGQLTGLTELRLLRGLHLSWELRKICHLGLTQLQVLSLHDSVVSEEELALLAPCTALQDLSTDTLRLSAVHSAAAQAAAVAAAAATAAAAAGAAEALVPPAAAAFGAMHSGMPSAAAAGAVAAAAGAAAGVAAGVAAAAAAEPRDHVAAAMLMLSRLRRLQVNSLHLSSHHLADTCPRLTHLSPLADTLAEGHSVVWDLGAMHGHPNLASLALMLGSLGTTCSCTRSFRASDTSVASLAAAAVRVLLHSTGLGHLGGRPQGVSLQHLLALLASLPQLRELELWGHIGGPSNKLLASVQAASTAGGTGTSGSSSSSRGKRRSKHGASLDGRRHSSNGSAQSALGGGLVAAAVGGLLCSVGSLLTPVGMLPQHSKHADTKGARDQGARQNSSNSGVARLPRVPSGSAAEAETKEQQPGGHHSHHASGGVSAAAAGSSTAAVRKPDADEELVVALLRGCPSLRLLLLRQCRHLSEDGLLLACATCGRHSGATVAHKP